MGLDSGFNMKCLTVRNFIEKVGHYVKAIAFDLALERQDSSDEGE
jgi:hypothetical protein